MASRKPMTRKTTQKAQPAAKTPAAHALGQEKRQRHADLYASGAISVKDIYDERRQEYAAHIDAMPLSDRMAIAEWAKRMMGLYGPVGTFQRAVLPWPSLFMVGRWGEEVAHWPKTLTPADRDRLRGLMNGAKMLKRVVPLSVARANLPEGAYLFGEDGPIGREEPTAAASSSDEEES